MGTKIVMCDMHKDLLKVGRAQPGMVCFCVRVCTNCGGSVPRSIWVEDHVCQK